MKRFRKLTKLTILTLFLLLTVGVLAKLFTETAEAAGETYQWTSSERSSIRGTGGVWDGATPSKEIIFEVVEANKYSADVLFPSVPLLAKCKFEIVIGADVNRGRITLARAQGDEERCRTKDGQLDRTITINNPPAGGIPNTALSHIHFTATNAKGEDETGLMNDGQGEEMYFFLQNSEGKYVWQICPTQSATDDLDVINHWFHPMYGFPLRFKDGTTLASTSTIKGLKVSGCGDLQEGGAGSKRLKFFGNPSYHWSGSIEPGKSYTVHAIGVGGNTPVIPDVFDAYNAYSATLLIKIDSSGSKYTYSSGEKNQEYDVNQNRNCANTGSHPSPCVAEHFIMNIKGTAQGGFLSLVNTALQWLADQLVALVNVLTGVLTDMITIPHSYFTTASTDTTGLVRAWGVARGLTNSLFVLALIIIAVANIVRFQIEQYDIRSALPRLIVAIILTNFSLLIGGLLVDFANILTLGIQNAFGSVEYSGVVTTTMQAVQALTVGLVMQLIFLVIFLVGFLLLLLVLAFRIAVIIAMAAISPVAFMLYAIPATANLFQRWMSNYFRYLMVGPVVVFLLLMSSAFVAGPPSIISMLLGIAFVYIAAMSPQMVGGKLFATAREKAAKGLRRAGASAAKAGLRRGDRIRQLFGGKETPEGMKGGLANVGLAAKRRIIRAATAPLRKVGEVGERRFGLAMSSAMAEKLKPFIDFEKQKAVPQRERDMKSKNHYIAFAALAAQDDADLADSEQFGDFFESAKRPNWMFDQATNMGMKSRKRDPLIGDVLERNLKARGRKVPPPIQFGAESVAQSMKPMDVASLSPSLFAFDPNAEPARLSLKGFKDRAIALRRQAQEAFQRAQGITVRTPIDAERKRQEEERGTRLNQQYETRMAAYEQKREELRARDPKKYQAIRRNEVRQFLPMDTGTYSRMSPASQSTVWGISTKTPSGQSRLPQELLADLEAIKSSISRLRGSGLKTEAIVKAMSRENKAFANFGDEKVKANIINSISRDRVEVEVEPEEEVDET